MALIFDTHAHISDKRFDEDREELLSRLPDEGVALVCDVACDLRYVDGTIKLIEENDFVFGAVGMHPHTAGYMDAELADALLRVLAHPKMLALGEIGLDYYYDLSPREEQRKWFDAQLSVAEEQSVPVVLHVRDAMGDSLDILRAHKASIQKNGGIMHCFSGSVESARECLDMGLMLGFGGSLTFKNNRRGVETAGFVPFDRFVFETDCPYLAPVPHRGERNDPRFIGIVAERFAEIRGITTEEALDFAFTNGCRVYRLDPEPATENGRTVYRRL